MVAVNKFVGHAFRRDAENHTPEAYAPRTRMLPGRVCSPEVYGSQTGPCGRF
jgi:hypothetical protein